MYQSPRPTVVHVLRPDIEPVGPTWGITSAVHEMYAATQRITW